MAQISQRAPLKRSPPDSLTPYDHRPPHGGHAVGSSDAAHGGHQGGRRPLDQRQAVTDGSLQQGTDTHTEEAGGDHNRQYCLRQAGQRHERAGPDKRSKIHQSNLECKIQCLCPILWDLFHADGNSYGALRLGIKNGLFRLIHRGTPFSHRGRKGLTRRSRGPSPGPARWVASLSQLSQRISPPRIKRAITVPWRITYGREARVRRASCTLSASIRFRSASLPTAMP